MKITKEELQKIIQEELEQMDEIVSFSGHGGVVDQTNLCRLARSMGAPPWPKDLDGVDCEKLLAAQDTEGSRKETRASRAPTVVRMEESVDSSGPRLSKNRLYEIIREELEKLSVEEGSMGQYGADVGHSYAARKTGRDPETMSCEELQEKISDVAGSAEFRGQAEYGPVAEITALEALMKKKGCPNK